MHSCPKCHSCRIVGPFLVKDPMRGERLRFRCGQCGYTEYQPTADADVAHADDSASGYEPVGLRALSRDPLH